jgi:hypothetical protein
METVRRLYTYVYVNDFEVKGRNKEEQKKVVAAVFYAIVRALDRYLFIKQNDTRDC